MAEGGSHNLPRFQRSRSIIHSLSQDEEPVTVKLEHKHGFELLAGLKKHRQSFVDIILKIGAIKVEANRLILSAFSPYFAALFNPNMLEGQKKEIELRELSGPMVARLVDFAYTGCISFSHDTVQELLETANFLGIKLVQRECVKFIVQQIDSQNVMDIFTLGKQLGEELMYQAASQYLIDNFVMLSKSTEFMELPMLLLEIVLQSESVQYVEPDVVPVPSNTEYGILHALLAYVAHHRADRLPQLPRLLGLVRLPTLRRDVLTQLMDDSILESPECQEVVQRALDTTPVMDWKADGDTWRKPRNNELLKSLLSRPWAAGGQLSRVTERFNDSELVPITAHLTGMKIYIRNWDGRLVWGGFEARYSNGVIAHHGGKDFGMAVHEFDLELGEMIIGLNIHCGWLIDQVTFKTSRGRSLGPYGGPGGGHHANRHSGREQNSGYLVCTLGTVVNDQNALAITCLRFQWAHADVRQPKPINTGSDMDSGEELSGSEAHDDRSSDEPYSDQFDEGDDDFFN